MVDDHHPDRSERRVFSPHFKYMFVLVDDWLKEASPHLRADFLRMAGIPPRYVVRWRSEAARRSEPTPGQRVGALSACDLPR